MAQVDRPEGKIFMALKARLDAFTAVDVYYSPDLPQHVPADDPFIVASFVPTDTDTRFVGSADNDEYRGFVSVAVMAPSGWTLAQGMGLASDVCDHFPKGAVYTFSDCAVKIMARPKLAGTPYMDNGRLRFPVNVVFRASL